MLEVVVIGDQLTYFEISFTFFVHVEYLSRFNLIVIIKFSHS